MTRSVLVFAALAAGAALPLAAQKNRPPAGVPTAPAARPATPADTSPTAGKRRPPTLMGTPARPDSAARPGVAAPGVVTPQAAARPAARANPFSAGVSVSLFAGGSLDEAKAYVRQAAPLLDSAVVLLVDVFRNTAGQPTAGAADPTSLSQREKDRWTRCRSLYWDMTTFRDGVRAAAAVVIDDSEDAALVTASAALDSALAVGIADTAAVAECDNVASMIEAPARWTPWGEQYQSAARRFYAGWYPAVRSAHDRLRALAIAFNATAAAEQQIPVPPALQRNPPYAGVVR